MNRLEGRVAIVTGGGSGIGAHTARLLRTEGARVCVTDVDVSGADDGFLTLEHDVSREEDWLRVRERVLGEFGRITTLVNNAGVFRPGMISDVSRADWERTIAVNQTGPMLGMRVFADPLAEAGDGSIVNLGSYAGMQGYGTSVAYQASKWAIRGLTRFAAREFAARGIRVNAVIPGFIETPMLASGGEELRSRVIRRTPLGRVGSPIDVARAVAYLASNDSAFVTGTELTVDGGMLS